MPYDARTGKPGSVTDRSIYMSYGEALAAMAAGGYDGIGFALTADDDFVGVDLDDCIGDDGSIDDEAMAIVGELPTYWEITPSGRGLRAFARGPCSHPRGDDGARSRSTARDGSSPSPAIGSTTPRTT